MTLTVFLDQPFVYFNTDRNRWIYIANSCCFTLLFLLLYQPFGLHQEFTNPVNSIADISIFILSIIWVVFIGLFVSQFVIRPKLHTKTISVKKYLWWYFIEVLILTLVNLLLIFVVPDLGNDPIEEELNFAFQLKNYFRIFTVLLFPFLGTILLLALLEMRKEIDVLSSQEEVSTGEITELVEDASTTVTFLDENNHPEFTLPLDSLLYLESSNQYVVVYYLEDGEQAKKLLRTRLKKLVDELEGLPILRCHRSFAVNVLQVATLKKVNQKAMLVFKNKEQLTVPVSRSYTEAIITYLEKQ